MGMVMSSWVRCTGKVSSHPVKCSHLHCWAKFLPRKSRCFYNNNNYVQFLPVSYILYLSTSEDDSGLGARGLPDKFFGG